MLTFTLVSTRRSGNFKPCVAEPSVSEASVAQNKEVGRSLLLRIVVGDSVIKLLKERINAVVNVIQITIWYI